MALALVLVGLLAQTAWAGFSASETDNSSKFSSATMQLESTTGSSSCYSTGSGSGGSITTNDNQCTTEDPYPLGVLSATAATSATTTLTSNGKVDAGASSTTTTTSSCGTNDVAVGEATTASSVETSTTNYAANATDGNTTTTRWESAYSDAQWLEVNFGATINFCNVVIYWQNAGYDFTIQSSTNGTSWTTMSTITNYSGYGTQVTETIPVSGSGQYIRMNGTERNNGYGYSIWELEVFTKTPGFTAGAATLSTSTCGAANLTDSAGGDTALAFGALSYQASGPLSTYGISLNGTSAWAETTESYANPEGFTVLLWFKATTSGAMLGFATTTSPFVGPGNYDRLLWLDSSGYLRWGVYSGANDEVKSNSVLTTGSWVFVAASIGSSGQDLYVNGSLQTASTASVTAAESYTGYWSLGAADATPWPNPPSSNYFNGSMGQVAIIPTQLSASAISTLYADNTASTYEAGVNTLTPTNYWMLTDTENTPYLGSVPGVTGSTSVADTSGNTNTGTAEGGVTYGNAGPSSTTSSLAFDGSSGWVQTTNSYANPENISLVAWFQTTSASGGGIIGFVNTQGNGSGEGEWDRSVWLDNAGQVVWSVYNTTSPNHYQIVSPNDYNDGKWHMVVAEIGSSGQSLWVDGTEVGNTSTPTSAQNYTGYWHLGWAQDYGWSNSPTDMYWSGFLSEVAVVPSQLGSATVSTLYTDGQASAGSFATEVGTLSPTSYWPMQDSGSNICNTLELTVQETSGTTTACIFPAQAGTCPSPSASYVLSGFGSYALWAPMQSGTVSVQVSAGLTAAASTATAGLMIEDELSVTEARSSTKWTAEIDFPGAVMQL